MGGIVEEQVRILRDGVISEIQINRPDSLNALNVDVLQGLILAIDRLRTKGKLRVLILSGEGEKAFVAGADIRSMSDLGSRAIADYIELGQRAMRTVEALEVPVIAAIGGYALGGGLELALACDIICATSAARVGQPEVNLGIIPGFGGTQRLARRVGPGAAKRLIFSGEIISADEAHRIGIVDLLFEDDQLRSEVDKLALTISEKAPLAIREAKQLLRATEEAQTLGGLRSEVEAFLRLFATADREEGMEAFMKKRKPEFQGR